MTKAASRYRPALWQAAIAFMMANACALSYALGRFDEQWIFLGALFLVLELGAAASAEPGDCFSERWWAWAGVRPVRPGRWHRAPGVLIFLAVLAGHLTLGPGLWWTSGVAVAITSAGPAFVVAAYLRRQWVEWRRRRA